MWRRSMSPRTPRIGTLKTIITIVAMTNIATIITIIAVLNIRCPLFQWAGVRDCWEGLISWILWKEGGFRSEAQTKHLLKREGGFRFKTQPNISSKSHVKLAGADAAVTLLSVRRRLHLGLGRVKVELKNPKPTS